MMHFIKEHLKKCAKDRGEAYDQEILDLIANNTGTLIELCPDGKPELHDLVNRRYPERRGFRTYNEDDTEE